eukprot:5882464-Lingulodinium_polyedra.AAC.1
MMRSNRRFAAAAVREPQARAFHARASFLARARSTRAGGARAVAAANVPLDRMVAQCLQNGAQDAVESAVCRCAGLQIARSRASRARLFAGAHG